MVWVVKQGRLDILQMYLKAGVDTNFYTLYGVPMLSHAAYEGQIGSARILLRYGADPCLPTLCGGQAPLMYAVYGTLAKFRDTEGPNMVELVLRAGAKITSLKLFKFICCDIVNPEHLVQLAIMNGTEFLALKDTWGETVLHKAVRYSEGLTALISKAAPELLHDRTFDGRAVLHVAVGRGCVAAARYLIALNENTDVVNMNGEKALHIAVKRDLKRVQLLTGRQEVDINGLNASNETPLSIAISYHTISRCYFDIVDHLLRDPRIYIDPMSVLAMKHLFRPTDLWLLLLFEDVILLIRVVRSRSLLFCLIYSEAHIRGTDLKLPSDAQGALTLGLNQTNDHTVQAAMRLRQLGTTQSVIFVSPPEVHQSILDARQKSVHDSIDSSDVLSWLINQTCNNNRDLQPLYLSQGIDFCQRMQASIDHKNFLSDSDHRNDYTEHLKRPEQQTLEQLYQPQSHEQCDLIPQVKGSMKNAALEEVEQEREVAFEIEQEREIQRPLSMKAHRYSDELGEYYDSDDDDDDDDDVVAEDVDMIEGGEDDVSDVDVDMHEED
ncbi:ankyrin repeat-containing domain protein [Aspergillus flavus]|uniref:ubiquitinyl hydrolase 1 n=1 Tax=Aspergillus flavus (strain ATCC 200026 / FGSC A1120 / IAM 13836 / NRRL 3357 / JCM 12722 / SRRC 167) TaxID=332952 RepID=A0A7U2MIQ1_ASPFN|nr:ankyrin repeat-containing domain protein [Aspergillus flavus]